MHAPWVAREALAAFFADHLAGVQVEIHAGDIVGTGQCGVDGEAAGVAAKVEHARALDELPEALPVVALVAEETGLVPLGEVHLVFHAVFTNAHLVGGGRGEVLHLRGLDPLEAAEVVVDLHARELRARQLVQQRQPFRQTLPRC